MSAPILATKLYIPSARSKIVARPHLVKQLNEGIHKKLIEKLFRHGANGFDIELFQK